MRLKLTVVAFATAITLLLPHDRLQATEAEDKARFDDCLPKAKAGDAPCQNAIGYFYSLGIGGVAQDNSQAIDWFLKAAEQGNASAQFNLWNMWNQGEGVPQDYVQVVGWYRKVAEQGDVNAQFDLGTIYFKGDIVTQDLVQAASYYLKAAEQGHAGAQVQIGFIYYNGQGVEQDDAQAASWFRKAAEQGEYTALSNLGYMYYNGRGVPKSHFNTYILFSLATPLKPKNYYDFFRDNFIPRISKDELAAANTIISQWKAGTPLPLR